MGSASTEARLEALEKEIKSLKKQAKARDKQIQKLEDIDAIKRLQCAYGYYLEHWMSDEIIDCFAMDNPEVSATLVEGTYKGPEGIRRYFGRQMAPDFLHLVMQLSPVITVAKDGKSAYGRWYGYGTVFFHDVLPRNPMMMAVIYEMDYIKDEGIWKILKFRLCMDYAFYNRDVIPEKNDDKAAPRRPSGTGMTPDEWATFNTQYPSGYIYPFSFVHPVTGKPTSEAKLNATLKLKPSPFKARGK
jgi:hypothetical protein